MCGPILQHFVSLECDKCAIQQKNYKNGSVCKFMVEVISWKLTDENHSCFLLMIGKQCGNKICKQKNIVENI